MLRFFKLVKSEYFYPKLGIHVIKIFQNCKKKILPIFLSEVDWQS